MFCYSINITHINKFEVIQTDFIKVSSLTVFPHLNNYEHIKEYKVTDVSMTKLSSLESNQINLNCIFLFQGSLIPAAFTNGYH